MKTNILCIVALLILISVAYAAPAKETACRIFTDRFGVAKTDRDLYDCTSVIDRTIYDRPVGKGVRYEIRWPDYLTDGELYVAVLPGLIYMRGGHNNPNSNGFYWYQILSNQQYSKIAKHLETIANGRIKRESRDNEFRTQYLRFSPLDRNEWQPEDDYKLASDDRLNYLIKNRNRLMMNNLSFILDELNVHCFSGKGVLKIQKESFISRRIAIRIPD